MPPSSAADEHATPAGPPPTDAAATPDSNGSWFPPAARRPITIYEWDDCGTRALGEQHCEQCSIFMARVGGLCPCCDVPVAVNELLDQEVTSTT